VRYEPSHGTFESRPEAAKISRADEKTLIAEGYCEIGQLVVSCSEQEKETLEPRLLAEAGKQGGDIVRVDAEHVPREETFYKNGKCTSEEKTTEPVQVRVNRTRCNSLGCFSEFDHFETSYKNVYTCRSWEQVPYTVRGLVTTGTVWRREPKCAMLSVRRIIASMKERIVSNIALDGERVYWVAVKGGKEGRETLVLMMAFNGGGAIHEVAHSNGNERRISTGSLHVAAHSNVVYWTQDDTVNRQELTQNVPAYAFASHPQAIAVSAKNVVWLNGPLVEAVKGSDGRVLSFRTIASEEEQLPRFVAVDEESAYWTVGQSLKKVPVIGGSPVVLASVAVNPVEAPTHPEQLVVDGDYVYWIDKYGLWPGETPEYLETMGKCNGSVMKVPSAGGAPTRLAANVCAEGIAVDSTNVYWSTVHSVWKIPKGGGAPVELASSKWDIESLAADASGVYYSDILTIYRLQTK
jgi:hypothetical protein